MSSLTERRRIETRKHNQYLIRPRPMLVKQQSKIVSVEIARHGANSVVHPRVLSKRIETHHPSSLLRMISNSEDLTVKVSFETSISVPCLLNVSI
jgi:hypothetical protein